MRNSLVEFTSSSRQPREGWEHLDRLDEFVNERANVMHCWYFTLAHYILTVFFSFKINALDIVVCSWPFHATNKTVNS